MSLCKELEDLGGGIKTRLERIVNIRDTDGSQSWIQECLVKYISMHYNACLVMYGSERRLLEPEQQIPVKVFQELLVELEGQAMIFLEAFEMFIDCKNNTEKKLSLIEVPCLPESKQGHPPDLVRVH